MFGMIVCCEIWLNQIGKLKQQNYLFLFWNNCTFEIIDIVQHCVFGQVFYYSIVFLVMFATLNLNFDIQQKFEQFLGQLQFFQRLQSFSFSNFMKCVEIYNNESFR
eukprot:TRINITY_DN5126_c0_g5_i1.p5 TRINITY_DN5126_c0_g5~~TRINITY_DN5126_c0_g5_i1.p5  ORF type:complete len:106 (-),score=5.81 TRINITY_DN5126_c0_g5_i1:297-614(-)